MSLWVQPHYASAAFVAVVLSGCASAMPPIEAVGVAQNANSVTRMDRLRLGGSWVSPEARSQTLLYVSGNSGSVYIFSFPKGKLVGTLTGFQEVAGVCADAAGNVWVANSSDFDLIEYAHAGTAPIATLPDYESYPFSCSVDRQNGKLAVSNIFSIKPDQVGSLAVYAGPSKAPMLFTDPNFSEYYFLTYGPEGTLYFDGLGYGSTPEVAQLHHGRFEPITISGATITSPGGMQYAEGSLTIGGTDSAGDAIVYRITDRGVVTGETTLLGAASVSYEIWKTYVICASESRGVSIYNYPAGGSPIKTLGTSISPFQAVISEAPKR